MCCYLLVDNNYILKNDISKPHSSLEMKVTWKCGFFWADILRDYHTEIENESKINKNKIVTIIDHDFKSFIHKTVN